MFSSKLKSKLEELLTGLEFEKRNRRQIRSKIIFNSILGLFIMVVGFVFLEQIYNRTTHYVYYVFPIIALIIASGFYLFKYPFVELSFYNKEIKYFKEELSYVEEILNLYDISYNYNINIYKEIHEEQEYEIDIKIIKK
jgi:hypothetical protein